MRQTMLIRTIVAVIVLAAAAPLLSACNTTAGAGQDISNTGAAVTRGANDVKRAM